MLITTASLIKFSSKATLKFYHWLDIIPAGYTTVTLFLQEFFDLVFVPCVWSCLLPPYVFWRQKHYGFETFHTYYVINFKFKKIFEKLKNKKLLKTIFVLEFLTLDLKVTLFRSTYGDLVRPHIDIILKNRYQLIIDLAVINEKKKDHSGKYFRKLIKYYPVQNYKIKEMVYFHPVLANLWYFLTSTCNYHKFIRKQVKLKSDKTESKNFHRVTAIVVSEKLIAVWLHPDPPPSPPTLILVENWFF